LRDRHTETKWNLWSTDRDALRKWSGGGIVLQSPRVLEDRASPEEGAPPLHTRVKGLPPGRYAVEMKMGRTLAVSFDGRTWRRQSGRDLGVFEIEDGVFEMWVDDRYAHPGNPGSGYYDCLTFRPLPPPQLRRKVNGHARARVVEKLDRGLVALPRGEGRVRLGWRLLAGDPEDVAFNVYRAAGGARAVRLNARPLAKTTDFVDEAAPLGADVAYFVRPVSRGAEAKPCRPVELRVTEEAQDHIPIALDGEATFQKVGVGDLDGDGRYDYVIKCPDSNIDPYRKYWHRSPGTYTVEARDADGRLLWRRDLGWAIERGIWYSPMIVHDLDGDGRAEVALKTGEGDPAAAGDPRDEDGRVTKGPERLTVLDGRTGRELARAPWPPREVAGEKLPYNYASRNQLGVAYLDGRTPCIIAERGTYTIIQVHAYDFDGQRLRQVWTWHSLEEDRPRRWRGQGAHNLQAMDIDGDGRDEVVLGSACLDDDGGGLWSTGLGHPDHCYVGELDPRRPGLEIYYGMETRRRERNGMCLVEAATGRVIWGHQGYTRHVHARGMCADIDPRHPGAECYSADTDERKKAAWARLRTCEGELISDDMTWGFGPHVAYWDGDACREVVHRNVITSYPDGERHGPRLKGRIRLVADILGDWREEIVTTVKGELRIYTTTIPARDRRVCLMQDPVYRNTVAAAAQGYHMMPTLGRLPSASR
jgi:rhamnogalacturonan endolyase